jgi:hypothetical protein
MAISNNSTGLRPGVCTSTTRPTAPYEGQMIYETDTDLTYIWGGSAWQQVSGGTAVGNSGLVYVKSQTVGTGVASVAVTGAFSADYENYKITYTNGASSLAREIDFSLNGSTLGHYAVMYYNPYAGGAAAGVYSNNRANWTHAGGGAALNPYMNIEVSMPFLAKPTFMTAGYVDASNTGMITGYQSQATSFTGFTIAPAAGTFTGGTITVYGYRKA